MQCQGALAKGAGLVKNDICAAGQGFQGILAVNQYAHTPDKAHCLQQSLARRRRYRYNVLEQPQLRRSQPPPSSDDRHDNNQENRTENRRENTTFRVRFTRVFG